MPRRGTFDAPLLLFAYAPAIVFIKRNRTKFGGKGYQSILLFQGKRVPAKRGPGRAGMLGRLGS